MSNFILSMAWRDSRRNRSRMLLFMAAIIAGIAALTAIRTFSYNLSNDIDKEAKSLLGADLLIEGNQPLPDSIRKLIMTTPGAEVARVYNLLSMVYLPRTGDTRLSMVRAADPGYPFFGQWKSEPADAWRMFHQGDHALPEHGLIVQFDIRQGDTLRIGKRAFTAAGDLLSRPGRAGAGSAIAPVVFIDLAKLDSTGLVQKGSRVWHQYFFRIPDPAALSSLLPKLEKPLDAARMDYETVESNKQSINRAFSSFATFLNLVGFVALLLGSIGVAGAVHLYIKSKLHTVAILRCLGASGRKAFFIYLTQVLGMGLTGSVTGALAGALLQMLLPWLGKDLLPIDAVSTDISWLAIAQGILLGVGITLLFALIPLSGILNASPLLTLRSSFDPESAASGRKGRLFRWGVYAALALVLLSLTWWITGNLVQTLWFCAGIGVAFLLLWGIAASLMTLLRKYFPKSWPYVWRQSLANLYRPDNQSVLLIVTIGLGAMLLSTLFLTQNLLLEQVAFAGRGKQPNMILFDIQTDQKDSVAAMVKARGLPVLQQVPIVTTRLESIDGRTKKEDQIDSTKALSSWVWDREYRVTFRDTLDETERIKEGEWTGVHRPGEPIRVSISDNLQRAMKAEIGTRLVFNVQGARLETVVGSVRKIDFNRMQTNFLVVFPEGVLEEAPQFHVLISRVENADQSAALQSTLVRKYPNISAIDITQILKSVDEILGKVSFVIRFMALFSIVTGLLVLISSIYQSKYARIRESVLLRTLGASRRQIRRINALEYATLGSLACISGIGLSVASAWALAQFAFKIPFAVQWTPLLLSFGAITGLTVLLGLLNSREVLRKPPLEVLRAEAGG